MTTSNELNLSNEIENNLIKEAYAATLDPSRLTEFETFWESYIDAQTQKNPKGFDWENTPVNAHITLAMDIIGKVRTINDKLEEAQHLVESHYGFGFIIDENGRIIVSNTDAQRFTSEADFLSDLAIDSISTNNIMNWMKDTEEYYSFFHVHIGGGSESIPLFISPIKIEPTTDTKSVKHFLITSVESTLSTVAVDVIGRSFGLSPAESQVAGMLTDACSPKEIANLRDVKITAVRTQIVKIKEKMGAKDIPDIVRLFISMGLRQKSVKTQIGRMEAIRGLNQRKTIREASMTLRDGRRLQYFEQGHPKGQIILYIHSLIDGVEFPELFSRGLVRSALRIISPSRAGFGRSEPNRKSNIIDMVDSCVADMIDLLDHINAEEVIVLTGWAGAIAQRLALKDTDRIKNLILSGVVPVWENHYLNFLSDRDRIAVKTSIHAPQALPYLVRVKKAMQASQDHSIFMGSLDKSSYKKNKLSDFQKVYLKKKFHHTLNQSIWAFIEDLPYIHKDWTDDARQLDIPVTIVKGEDNKDQPSGAIARYKTAVPHAIVRTIKSAGSNELLMRFAEFLDVFENAKNL